MFNISVQTSPQSSYIVTSGGFSTAESAMMAGYPVISPKSSDKNARCDSLIETKHKHNVSAPDGKVNIEGKMQEIVHILTGSLGGS